MLLEKENIPIIKVHNEPFKGKKQKMKTRRKYKWKLT